MITEVKTKVYAGRLKDRASLLRSSSGGAFVALSDCFLDNGDAVVCAVYNYEDHATEFQLIENREERDKSIGSKYMQSKPGKIYKIAEDWLINHPEKRLLFVGMGCQADGFRKFAEMKGFRERVWIVDIICHGSPSPRLWKEYAESDEKKYGKITYLTFKDIVCHGVPSPVVWDKYLRWQEHKNHGKVVKVDFRNKKDFGWKDHVETIWFDNGKNVSSPIFKNLFYGHMVLRPSCYECPYKSIMHPGDITIADYWGIEKAAPEFDDNKGVSLVLVNNEKADSIFENVKIELKWKSTRIEDSMQPPLKAPFPKPEGREQFWNDVNDKSFSYIARAYGDNGTANYIKKVLRRAKRKIQHLISKT